MIYLGEAESHTEYHRGDIFYIHREAVSYGHEQRPGRPAVIVSNDFINQNSTVLEVVYLTTKEKRVSPTHIVIESSLRRSTVLCEQITSVDKEFVGNYIGRCTEEEMRKIDYALVISLALKKSGARRRSRVSKPGLRTGSVGNAGDNRTLAASTASGKRRSGSAQVDAGLSSETDRIEQIAVAGEHCSPLHRQHETEVLIWQSMHRIIWYRRNRDSEVFPR